MSKTVSIIVPVYNVERYLRECLDSLAAQSYKNFEAILIDDGSTDTSGEICREYANKDGRFQVIYQANAGAASAKNAGLDAAEGEYIAFVDSDDWVEPDWIESMLAAAVVHKAGVVESGFDMAYTTHTVSGNKEVDFKSAVFETEDYMRCYPKQWTCALFWNKLFKSSLLKDVRFRTERRCIDDEFFTYKAVSRANKVVRITERLYHYRQRLSSVTKTGKTIYQRTVDNIDILEERHRWIKRYYPRLAMDYLCHDVDVLLYLAENQPFDDAGVAAFRKSAGYYMMQCLRKFPGKVTFYYALRALFLPKRAFGSKVVERAVETEKYFP